MSENRCGDCNGCCSLFPVEEINKPRNTLCQYWDNGCTIYDKRPQACRDYDCGYIQGKGISEKLRPDKCGIIFSKRSERIFTGSLIPLIDVTEEAKKQVYSFSKQGFSVILFSVDEPTIHIVLSEGHNEQSIKEEYTRLINGNV